MRSPRDKAIAAETARQLAHLHRQSGVAALRPAAPSIPFLQAARVLALVNAGDLSPSVGGFLAVDNALGIPLWKDSTVVLYGDEIAPAILWTNAAKIVRATYLGGSKLTLTNYGSLGGVDGYFDSTGVADDTFLIVDNDVLDDLTTAGQIVEFQAGANDGAGSGDPPNAFTPLRVVETGGGGSGGDPWTGWPNPDPTTGLSTVKIAVAYINHAGGYTAGGGVLAFDGASAIVGDLMGSTTGSAANATPAPFLDNENFLIIRDGVSGWSGFKLRNNVLKATVGADVDEDAATFSFTGGTAIEGIAPAGGTGTCDNADVPTGWAAGEKIIVEQRDDGKWQPRKLEYSILRGYPITDYGPSATTMVLDTLELVQGQWPGVETLDVTKQSIFKKGTTLNNSFTPDDRVTIVYDLSDHKWRVWVDTTAKATITNAMALITGVVPARGAVSGDRIVPGKLAAGARMYVPDPDEESEFTSVIYSGDGDYNPMDVWNFSLTEFDGSGSDDGILVAGQVFSKQISDDPPAYVTVFVINSDKDFASLPGFDKAEFQIPYHDETENGFQLGAPIAKLLKKLAGWLLGSNQSVGHDEAGDPSWQNDETCE